MTCVISDRTVKLGYIFSVFPHIYILPHVVAASLVDFDWLVHVQHSAYNNVVSHSECSYYIQG